MRVLAINDISCIGKCSLTATLPILSACGIECTVLPTAILSTHTGGFTGYTFRDQSGFKCLRIRKTGKSSVNTAEPRLCNETLRYGRQKTASGVETLRYDRQKRPLEPTLFVMTGRNQPPGSNFSSPDDHKASAIFPSVPADSAGNR